MTVRAYLTALLAVTAVTAVASAIAAEGTLKKYVNFILSVVVMLTLLAPLGDVLGSISAVEWLPETEAGGGVSSSEALLEVTAETLRARLCEELSLPVEEVQVHIDGRVQEGGEVTIREISVLLSGESRTARERVRGYLQARTECSVRVSITS